MEEWIPKGKECIKTLKKKTKRIRTEKKKGKKNQ